MCRQSLLLLDQQFLVLPQHYSVIHQQFLEQFTRYSKNPVDLYLQTEEDDEEAFSVGKPRFTPGKELFDSGINLPAPRPVVDKKKLFSSLASFGNL